MGVETMIALGGAAGLALTSLIVAYLLVRQGAEPWRLLGDERLRRVRAEADRDAARLSEGRIAAMSVQKDKDNRAQADEIARLQAKLRARPGDGTASLQEQADAEDAGRVGDAADLSGDPSGPVPRVTTPGALPIGPILPR